MLEKITVKNSHPLFERMRRSKEELEVTFDFQQGVNVLCGYNGVGKSSFFRAVKSFLMDGENQASFEYKIMPQATPDHQYVYFLDMRTLTAKEMLRAAENELKPSIDTGSEILRMWQSNGEQMSKVVGDIAELGKGARLIFLDEPELSLDFESMANLMNVLDEISSKGCMVVAISHHPLLVLNKNFNVIGFDGTDEYQKGMKSLITKLL